MKKTMDIQFNQNEDSMKLLISEMKQKRNNIELIDQLENGVLFDLESDNLLKVIKKFIMAASW